MPSRTRIWRKHNSNYCSENSLWNFTFAFIWHPTWRLDTRGIFSVAIHWQQKIRLEANAIPRICWNLIRTREDYSNNNNVTRSTKRNTPNKKAPEILKGEKATKSADWWSVGIIIYEMLADIVSNTFADNDAIALLELRTNECDIWQNFARRARVFEN